MRAAFNSEDALQFTEEKSMGPLNPKTPPSQDAVHRTCNSLLVVAKRSWSHDSLPGHSVLRSQSHSGGLDTLSGHK